MRPVLIALLLIALAATEHYVWTMNTLDQPLRRFPTDTVYSFNLLDNE